MTADRVTFFGGPSHGKVHSVPQGNWYWRVIEPVDLLSYLSGYGETVPEVKTFTYNIVRVPLTSGMSIRIGVPDDIDYWTARALADSLIMRAWTLAGAEVVNPTNITALPVTAN